MTQRKADPLWAVARWPFGVGVVCLVGGVLVLQLDEETPYNCDFSCAMSSIGWQDLLALLLFILGIMAFLMFAMVCVLFGVLSVVDSVRDRWR
ncbi:hypothetical protein HUT06_06715 [Actinomadura sp. NAK00032]|uniref:hypothetical protein n=1 Tax=Actinomadura sp. NAK00032 TaxID=2742128 RepID=UPI0015903671|nr:hypothetical protein [Actinomadura sp. NAK00032]QKW33762.1 hypothetical protein HUT06_06715 [Actinomadura sp. NAK00032]